MVIYNYLSVQDGLSMCISIIISITWGYFLLLPRASAFWATILLDDYRREGSVNEHQRGNTLKPNWKTPSFHLSFCLRDRGEAVCEIFVLLQLVSILIYLIRDLNALRYDEFGQYADILWKIETQCPHFFVDTYPLLSLPFLNAKGLVVIRSWYWIH